MGDPVLAYQWDTGEPVLATQDSGEEPTGPSVPTNLQTTDITQTSARLSWDAPT